MYNTEYQDIVTEFMNKGNLLDMLKNKQEQISTQVMIMMAKQTASGNLINFFIDV